MPLRVTCIQIGWLPFLLQPLWNLVSALAARGDVVSVVRSQSRSLGMPDEPHPNADNESFALFTKRFTRWPLVGSIARAFAFIEFTLRACLRGRRVHPDLVIAIDVDALPAGWLLSKWSRKPLLYYSFELYTDRPGVRMKWLWNAVERRLIRQAALVVACEPNRARILKERYALPELPLTVLNAPPRPEAMNATSNRIQTLLRERGITDARIAYYHGWINRARCADVFLDAAQYLNEGIVLFLLGPIEPAFREFVERLLRERGLENRVLLHPVVPTEQLQDFAVSAHLGLQIQRNEGLNTFYCAPIKLFQYLAAGLPVVASNFPGMVEIVEGNRVGICVDPEDPHALALAVNTILSDDRLRAEMSANALRVAREKYCYEIEGGKLLDAIDSILELTK